MTRVSASCLLSYLRSSSQYLFERGWDGRAPISDPPPVFSSEVAASHLGFELEWQGNGVDEKGVDKVSGKTIVEVNPDYFRPAEVELLHSDPSKARQTLGWDYEYSFADLVKEMAEFDLQNEQDKKFEY